MRRANIPDRFHELMRAAAKVFISRGYRRATMADIAREMGVAPGTLYLYVESKEALFHLLAMRNLVDRNAEIPELPVRTPPAGATLEMLRDAASLESLAPRLAETLSKGTATWSSDEIGSIIGDVYDGAYEHRTGINLMEGSAIDWPDMAEIYYHGLRKHLVEGMTRYLEQGVATGRVRAFPDAAIAARLVVETIAWFAIHRHGDRGGEQEFSNEEGRATVVDMLAASILKEH